ncbi:MAG: pyridoxamine 5'-phosphate oxidase family protein [Ahrensia sp.]|nr:pyridoxamine 5'-phosphate oxidase family protein [Ahrensia sp.]
MIISDAAREIIEQFPLGFVATVTKDGAPSLSPKGTFLVLDDETLAFAEIRSPNTMANLAHRGEAEVNFIDIWKRKGVRVFGNVQSIERGSEDFDALYVNWEGPFPALAPRINAVVKIACERVKIMTTPPYDDGVTEEEMIALYKAKFAEIYP